MSNRTDPPIHPSGLEHLVLPGSDPADSLEQSFNDFSAALSALGDSLTHHFDTLERQFDTIDSQLDAFEGHLGGIEGHLGGIEGHLGGIEGIFNSVDRSLSRIESHKDRTFDLLCQIAQRVLGPNWVAPKIPRLGSEES